ncbi:hypothetical protein C7M84_007873 [Penaeus vannamei]|uniref:PDZ domain-containing protein n=1 Tax=Penaeus vannamei TaxID=6689 RepID=A0A3R7PQ76_PENVA|nr:hypothetical protein C7M84_007873 [Penaeus vannamei]
MKPPVEVVAVRERQRPEEDRRKSHDLPDGGAAGGADEGNERRSSVVILDRPNSLVEKEVDDASVNSSLLSALSSSPKSKRTASRTAGRAMGYTMNLSGKFVTELTLFDPSEGPVRTSHINLGVFLATDQAMGDHSIYKVSPVSPLAMLKIKTQDRLVRLNDVSVEGWSHSSVVDFVRNLTLADNEYRRAGKMVRSTDEAPTRATVDSVKESEVRVRHDSEHVMRLRLKHDLPLYVKVTTRSNGVMNLGTGETDAHDETVCFTLHLFTASPPYAEGGQVVVLETGNAAGLVYANSPASIGVLQGTTVPVAAHTQVDIKFFLLHGAVGSPFVSLRNLLTGNYLSASQEGLRLVRHDINKLLPDSCLFQVHHCQH